MKRLITLFSCVLFILFICSGAIASPDKKKKANKKDAEDAGTTISLVTSGTGDTKDDAIKSALRSALEQTFGTFVSSNSQVVNDELIRDEIISISSGNIVSYEVVSFLDSIPKQVVVKSVVSITKLQSYAQNKGMSAELAGNTFAMNIKMEELNIKNQEIALQHMLERTKIMTESLFDYGLSVYNPEKTPKGVQVPITIIVKANNNTISFYEYFHKTLASLAVNIGRYPQAPLDCNPRAWGVDIYTEEKDPYGISYELRGDCYNDREPSISKVYCDSIFITIRRSILNCEIVDNLGNVSRFEYKVKDNHTGPGPFRVTNKLSYGDYNGYGRIDFWGCRNNYKGIYSIYANYPPISSCSFWLNLAKPEIGEKLYAENG